MSASVAYSIEAEASVSRENAKISACLDVFYGQKRVSVSITASYQERIMEMINFRVSLDETTDRECRLY